MCKLGGWVTYTYTIMYKIASGENAVQHWGLSSVFCGDLEGWDWRGERSKRNGI